MIWIRSAYACAGLVLASMLTNCLAADSPAWPSRLIRWVIPLPPGTSPDLLARSMSQKLSEHLGQSVVVENRPGGAHNVAMQSVARSEPDGYTMLHVVTSLVTNPHLYKLTFDPVQDFAPVARIAETEWALVVRSGFSARTLSEVVEYAKNHPGLVSCATTGGLAEIACRAWASRASLSLVAVPYKGGPQALADMLNGTVDLRFENPSVALPLLASGKIRALATLNARRGSPAFGDIPTMAESSPGLEFVTWQGLVVRQGTPAAVIARLSAEIRVLLADAEIRRSVIASGNVPAYATAQEFGGLIRRDLGRFGTLIRDLAIRPDD